MGLTLEQICPKLTIKIPERRQWGCSGIFIINFENILYLALVSLLLTLSRYMPAGIAIYILLKMQK